MKPVLPIAALFGLVLALPAMAAEQKPADAGKGAAAAPAAPAAPAATAICAGCHGADGNSAIPQNPNLAGQVAQYITKQLTNFKDADKATGRKNAIMQGMVATLSPEDMKALGVYYAAQPPKGGIATDKALAEKGERLWRGGDAQRGIPACAGCHSPNGAGIPAQYPRLAGQHAEYTAAQLKAFRAGERQNDPNRMMQMIAVKLTDQDVAALAQYAQGLR
ncbi:MAG TPA: c-type cytochrome [Burkholderiales bacterium]|nr:c-type cytochrome [Burkholderiales bacterium]